MSEIDSSASVIDVKDNRFLTQSIYEMEVFVLPNEGRPVGPEESLAEQAVLELISESTETWNAEATGELAPYVVQDIEVRPSEKWTSSKSIYEMQSFQLHATSGSGTVNNGSEQTVQYPRLEPNYGFDGSRDPRAITLDMTTGAPDPQIGNLVGNYRIFDVIGRGNMAIVYKACHLQTGAVVAAKTYKPSSEPAQIQRFAREVETHAKLSHENIVHFIDCVIGTDNRQYLIMENVKGLSLQAVLDTHGPVENPANIWSIFSQICDALSHAHERGVIHRDLKPGNVILSKKQGQELQVKLADFGIAHDESDLARLTQEGSSIGSPLYMSPEQCQGYDLTPRSDVYSLGILMTETISGVCPYRGKSIMSIIRAHCNPMTKPVPLSSLCPQLPGVEQLQEILFRALETEPENRFQSVKELKHALAKWYRQVSSSPQVTQDCIKPCAQTQGNIEEPAAQPQSIKRRINEPAVTDIRTATTPATTFASTPATTPATTQKDARILPGKRWLFVALIIFILSNVITALAVFNWIKTEHPLSPASQSGSEEVSPIDRSK